MNPDNTLAFRKAVTDLETSKSPDRDIKRLGCYGVHLVQHKLDSLGKNKAAIALTAIEPAAEALAKSFVELHRTHGDKSSYTVKNFIDAFIHYSRQYYQEVADDVEELLNKAKNYL